MLFAGYVWPAGLRFNITIEQSSFGN